MVSKNNRKLIAEKNRKNEKQRFALRKLNVGVASVLLGITFSVYGGGQMVAHADVNSVNADTKTASATGEETLADKSKVALQGPAKDSGTEQTTAAETTQQKADTDATPAENMGGELSYY